MTRTPRTVVIWQLVAASMLVSGLLLWDVFQGDRGGPWWGLEHTVSALAAGIASIVPTALYAWQASAESSAVRFLFQGVLKFAFTIGLIAVSIVVIKPAAASFFGTLILLQMMYVAAPMASSAPGHG